MESKEARLLELAETVKTAATAEVAALRTHLNYKADLDKRKAEYQLKLKVADPKATQIVMNLKSDVEFANDQLTEIGYKLAAKTAEIEKEDADNRFSIEKIIASLSK